MQISLRTESTKASSLLASMLSDGSPWQPNTHPIRSFLTNATQSEPGLEHTGFMSSCCLLKCPEARETAKDCQLSPTAQRKDVAAGHRPLASSVRSSSEDVGSWPFIDFSLLICKMVICLPQGMHM